VSEDLTRILGRLGNDIVGINTHARNLADDYQQLLSQLDRLLKARAGENVGKITGREWQGLADRVTLRVFSKDGKLKQEYDSGWSPNGITNVGFAEVAGLILLDVGGTAFDYIAIGTGTTAFDPTQTSLVSEVIRKAGTGSKTTTSVTDDTAQLVTTFSSADGLSGSHSITESGVFNASSGGTMLCRQTFSALNIDWDAGDTLQVTWKIQIKQG